MINALNMQLRRDVGPALGLSVPIIDYYENNPPTVNEAVVIQLMDDPDVPNAAGYHDEDAWGQTFAKVFIRPTLNQGGTLCNGPNSVSVTISHELIETIGDEHVQLWATNYASQTMVAYELCDPVEMDDEYCINHVSVSNFVTDNWFDAFARPSSQFDFLHNLKSPFTLSPGGYMTVMNGQEQKQVFGSHYPEWRKPLKAGSRRMSQRTLKRG